jgi:hypothetical protein
VTQPAPNNKRQHQPMDTRLQVSTAQFLAAGSFGPVQASVSLWETYSRIAIMEKAFPLKTSSGNGSRCLQELIDPSRPDRFEDAFRIAAAMHTYGTTLVTKPTASFSDQRDWAEYWSRVLARYNAAGEKYKVAGSGATKGLSEIGKEATSRYCAMCTP